MRHRNFDFEHAKLLMETIVEAGKHGPLYQKLAGWAGEELKAMMAEVEPDVAAQPRVITPSAGPANSMVQQDDGSYVQVAPAPRPVQEAPTTDRTKLERDAEARRRAQTMREREVPGQRAASLSTAESLTPEESIDRRL